MKRLMQIASAICMVGLMTSLAQAGDLAVGSEAPSFKATSVEGKEVTLDSVKDADIVVVVFTCNTCPVAVAYEDRFIEFNKKYKDKKVAFVAINNSTGEDVEAMQQRAEEKGLNYTYAYDGSGDSARAYGAKVTPHCFVLDKNRKLVYKGSFDDAWNGEPETSYVSSVVGSLLEGEAPKHSETKPVGCGIKLKR